MNNLETRLGELFTRFCSRNGRHGETYLLEEGLRKGLINQLMQLIQEERRQAKEEVVKVMDKVMMQPCSNGIEKVQH